LSSTWFDEPHRPTRDLDLLGFGDPDPGVMLAAFREICAIELDDGVAFDLKALGVDRIREELEYGGLRIKTNADVGGARVRVAIDIGFGDVVEPGFVETELPVLLDLPPPRLRTYPREAVIAEKFQAMVALGRANSRMKDFYDIWLLARTHVFGGDAQPRAIAATFARRKTEIPVEPPDALIPAFASDPAKVAQWNAFIDDLAVQPGTLDGVIKDLTAFLLPAAALARERKREYGR
jgi:hypothetical protein